MAGHLLSELPVPSSLQQHLSGMASLKSLQKKRKLTLDLARLHQQLSIGWSTMQVYEKRFTIERKCWQY